MSTITPTVIVEDEIAIGKVLSRTLSRGNFEAVHFLDTESGYHALRDLLSKHSFALLLTDNDVERGDAGLALIKKVRKDGLRIPIIQMSGYDIGREAIQTGADHFIQKPFENDELLNIVQNSLNTYSMRGIIERLCHPFRGIPFDSNTRDRFDIVNYNLYQFEKQDLVVVKDGKLSVPRETMSRFEEGIEVVVRLTNGAEGTSGIATQVAEPLPEETVKIAYREGIARRVI